MSKPEIDEATNEKLEAQAFRALVAHLRARPDVQNIDLMNLAGFCRNCLSRWYREAAESIGLSLADAEAREIIYGMPYKTWQAETQRPASDASQAAFAAKPDH
ncbi:MAG: DUF1244 domain-containing protein [Acidocella sp.]|nr:DUF1244 domain-containing protein [Acidocella sp.]